MSNVQNPKGANKKDLPLFFSVSSKVTFSIIFISSYLLYVTFTFDEVPPILNRGIQPATFPKALLILIILLSFIVFLISLIMEAI